MQKLTEVAVLAETNPYDPMERDHRRSRENGIDVKRLQGQRFFMNIPFF
ncbi:MAG: hypothetical protein ACLUEQ_09365 [Cloacibacillus evryensis]